MRADKNYAILPRCPLLAHDSRLWNELDVENRQLQHVVGANEHAASWLSMLCFSEVESKSIHISLITKFIVISHVSKHPSQVPAREHHSLSLWNWDYNNLGACHKADKVIITLLLAPRVHFWCLPTSYITMWPSRWGDFIVLKLVVLLLWMNTLVAKLSRQLKKDSNWTDSWGWVCYHPNQFII